MKSVLILFLLTGAFLASSCSPQKVSAAASAKVTVDPPQDPNIFSFDRPEEFPLVAAEARKLISEGVARAKEQA